MKIKLGLLALGLALAAHPAPAQIPSDSLTQAVTAPGRPADMVAQDANREPAETLAFFALAPGQTVVDIGAGAGYFTEIVARAVGPEGRVHATLPQAMYDGETRAALDGVAARNPNVTLVIGPVTAFEFPANSVDLVLMSMIYHDAYFVSERLGFERQNPRDYLARVFAALRPGGVVGVVDHVANPGGDTRAVVDALHRIDPAVVRADFEAAGFALDGESDLLRNPADDHRLDVFDPAIRGRTDRFVMRFRKPA
ncbi:MAG: class I SAM-dependent methyltransferase [Sphingomonadaceae bacterium]|nr:class I SAM-dependent methyltransferase [Sphingomonadaceae bacterium]